MENINSALLQTYGASQRANAGYDDDDGDGDNDDDDDVVLYSVVTPRYCSLLGVII